MTKSRRIVVAGVAVTGVALLGQPAHAASGEVVITKWVNDVPYSKQCSTSVVSLYNASNAPVRSVSILWKGSTLNGWRWLRKKKSASWSSYPVYIAPGRTYKLRKWVCATYENPPGKYSWESDVSVKPVNIRWAWY